MEIIDGVVNGIGRVTLLLSTTLGVTWVFYYLVDKILSALLKYSPSMWIMMEYAYHRKAFKQWVKDKERLKNPNVKPGPELTQCEQGRLDNVKPYEHEDRSDEELKLMSEFYKIDREN